VTGQDALETILDMVSTHMEPLGAAPRLLRIPVSMGVALLHLGAEFWGERWHHLLAKGVRGLEEYPLFGMKVVVAIGRNASVEIE
jgi:hypothetical protein